jgi:hypothetical protein
MEMSYLLNRRTLLSTLAGGIGASLIPSLASGAPPTPKNPKWESAIENGLNWLAKQQSKAGYWADDNYPAAVTALAGTALISSGSTTTQGPYAKNIQDAVTSLWQRRRSNGLIGDPQRDNRYTYGHGFSMLFLSQILGEEEDIDRRKELTDTLEKAVKFSVEAQCESGGWGYVSAKDNSNFDEGSTTITQVQGLRGCRNAGIIVPKEAIEKARDYIYKCKNDDGGISYSFRNRGSSRPAITAASVAALHNAGEYTGDEIEAMKKYCKLHLHDVNGSRYGHWHYTYLYYAQVVYRESKEEWETFREKLYNKIVSEQKSDGSWTGNISPTYVTAMNLIILQLDKGLLPIYQK